MMLIPDYLTTNQSEECRSADRASQDPSLTLSLKTFPKSLWGVQDF